MKNKVLGVLLSLIIAFGLWLYVVTVVSPGSDATYYNIPVTLQNENILKERGLMITSEYPSVNLRLEGNRTDLSKLNSGNITVLANVAGILAPGTHFLDYSESYPGDIAGNSVAVLNKDPELIVLKVEKRITKPVPVVIQYEGVVPEGFLADKENIELDYQTIDVTGPESAVSRVEQAIIYVDLSNQAETLIGEFAYVLCDGNAEAVDVQMVTTNVEAVNLTLRILRVKEILLTVQVVDGGGATEETSSINIEPKKILISGSDTLLEGLETLNLGAINLATMEQDSVLTYPILLPEGVNNETGLSEAVVNVQFPALKTKEFEVTTINAINVPEGMEAEVVTKVLPVTIRGPKQLVEKMKETDVSVNVDFTNAQLGAATMKAEIVIADAYKEVGAMGSYSVMATLKELEEEKK